MKRAFSTVIELVFILLFVYGFLCLIGEADPWSIGNQILLFARGILFMLIGFFGCAFIEGRETA